MPPGTRARRCRPRICRHSANGKIAEIELPDEVQQIYAVTMDGLLSNPADVSGEREVFRFTILTKGGFLRPPHPILEPEQDDST